MQLRFLIALVVILSVLFFGHLAVYHFLVAIFAIQSAKVLWVLGILTVALPISFIGSLVLGEWFTENILVKFWYRFSCVWLCYFLYLFLGAVVYSVFSWFITNPAVLLLEGKIIFIMAIVASSYGVLHANNIKTKKITVELRNLPLHWKERRMVFISDIHLGHIRGRRFAQKIVEKINSFKPDVVLIGGDMFDGAKGDPKKLVEPFGMLKPQFGKYFVMGNHEEFEDPIHFRNALEAQGVKVLFDDVVNVEGIQIVGVDYLTTLNEGQFKNTLEKLTINREVPSILLKHVPSNLDVAHEKGIMLSLHGHTHRAQAWPLNIFTHFLFKGFDYGLKKLKSMTVYTSSGIGTWGPPIRVGSDSELIVINFK